MLRSLVGEGARSRRVSMHAQALGRAARRLLCGLCVVLGAFSGPFAPNAWAQVAPSAVPPSGGSSSSAPSARVEELLAKGIQSREAGHDADALDYYRQAVALQPENPRVLAHLGATYHALGRWVPAHTYLMQALQYHEDPYIQRHRGELEDALSTVADHLGFLEVYGAPSGAEALINGQLVATLPMAAPVPVIVGSYLLEVRLANHYTLGRPITISKRVLTREEVELSPHRPGAAPENTLGAAAQSAAPAPGNEPRSERTLSWLPWTLGGLGVAAAVTSVVAWERREHYAERWNDDDVCVGVGVSREENCSADLDRGQRAETIMYISAGATGLFAAGAVLSAILTAPSEEKPVAGFRCAPGLGGAACFGTF